MLPNLSNLSNLDPTVGGKRKRAKEEDGPIFFKAFKKGAFRKLSNLFGPVEWAFQRQKFKEGTPVFEWLLEGERKARAGEWTIAAFDEARKRMKHDGKLDSYVDVDGAVASGLLAQMTSLMVKNPDSTDARRRLGYILGRAEGSDLVPKDEMLAWHARDVQPPLSDEAKREFMLTLLRDKYATNCGYRALLLSTGQRPLHEAKGRGQPSVWEFVELSEAQRAKGFSPGGDLLGQLLTIVRAELRGESSSS